MKLSLIITTKNRAHSFERALNALIREKREGYPNTEIVVTDAGSTDGTVDIIRRNEAFIDKWISEPDSGVSEGFNRACALATGDVIWPAGDDDIIEPGAAAKMMAYMNEHPELDVVFGRARMLVEEADGSCRPETVVRQNTLGRITKKTIGRYLFEDFLVPEAGFFKKCVIDAVKGYDLSLHYWAFWDFFFRLAGAGARMYAIPDIVVERHNTPSSDSRQAHGERGRREHDVVAYKHGGYYLLLWRRWGGRLSLTEAARELRNFVLLKNPFHPRRMWRDFLRRVRS